MIDKPWTDYLDPPTPLTKAEGEELRSLRVRIEGGDSHNMAEFDRYRDLSHRCLMWGSEGVEAQSFVGLEPRYGDGTLTSPPEIADSGKDDGDFVTVLDLVPASSVWFVSYGEEFQLPDPANAPLRHIRSRRLYRLKWAIEARAQAALDFINEAQYRVRRAWEVLRHG